jgi:hypothetical protein
MIAINHMFLDLSIGGLLAMPGYFLRHVANTTIIANMKDIVMERIELLESVNQNSSNWRPVVQ